MGVVWVGVFDGNVDSGFMDNGARDVQVCYNENESSG